MIASEPTLFQGIEKVLANGAASVAQIQKSLGQPLPTIIRALSLLLESGRIGLDRGAAGESCREQCQKVNSFLLDRMLEARKFEHLIAPMIGNVVGVGTIEAVLLRAQAVLGINNEDDIIAFSLLGLESLGGTVRDHAGNPLLDENLRNFLADELKKIKAYRMKSWKNLGVITAG